MANVNLSAGAGEDFGGSSSGGGLGLIFLVFLIVVGLYGGTFFYGSVLDKDMEKVQNDYALAYSNLVSGEAKEVVDFANRSDISKGLLSKGEDTSKIFSEIERVMLPGIYLDSYEYKGDEKSVSVKVVCNNFDEVGKQLVNFKSSDMFDLVRGNSALADVAKNKIIFSVDLKIK